ncbi:MAG TPA: FkbM family methyltransferase [Bryobacteraceae bacterium]|nr:FkbM family methyltransferase [Bryobacteraceae bacterium]
MKKSIRYVISFGIVILAGWAAIAWAPQARFYSRLIRERSRYCSATDVFRTALVSKPVAVRILKEEPDGLALFDTPIGQFWAPRRNQGSLPTMISEVEGSEYTDGRHPVERGDVVLDCGANVGVFTRHALRMGARLVVAIEIAPENIGCLRRNFAGEIQAGKVIVYPKGVWDKDDTLVLRVYDVDSGSNTVALHPEDSEEGPTVPLTTIDKIVAELKLDRVDFIKMDIDGAERNALRGAIDTVRRYRPALAISLEHGPRDAEEIPDLIHRQWPQMDVRCPPCVRLRTDYVNRLQPPVVYAR